MDRSRLNVDWIAGNGCFGCGPDNPHGLRIAVYRDPEVDGRLLGELVPDEHATGFPGIAHGGAIYTALDCMATWSGMALVGTRAIWVLRSATMRYLRPAFAGRKLALSATVAKGGGPWDAIEVLAEARDPAGALVARGSFDVVPLPPEKFLAISGLEELPAGWARWLAGDEAAP